MFTSSTYTCVHINKLTLRSQFFCSRISKQAATSSIPVIAYRNRRKDSQGTIVLIKDHHKTTSLVGYGMAHLEIHQNFVSIRHDVTTPFFAQNSLFFARNCVRVYSHHVQYSTVYSYMWHFG